VIVSEWIKLDPQFFSARATQRKRQDGIQIAVSLSPYDIPDAVRGRFESRLGRFVIEFSYIEAEKWDLHPHREGLFLRVGKNSGRLYGIEVDVKQHHGQPIALTMRLPKLVSKAIDAELAQNRKADSRQENYELAKSVLSNEGHTLYSQLAEAGA
jgi:hypothetical protein